MWRATLVGTVLQVATVVGGHYQPAIRAYYAPGGLLISFLAGWLYSRLYVRSGRIGAALGGLIAGGVCASVGILEALSLRDVPFGLLLFGPAAAAVAGALGGALGSRRSS